MKPNIIPQELIQDIVAQNVTIFLGNIPGKQELGGNPGPTEQNLVNYLAKILNYTDTTHSFTTIAQHFEHVKGRQALVQALFDLLAKTPTVPDRLHHQLARLPSQLYLTSDIHQHLEQSLQSAGRSLNKVVTDKDLGFNSLNYPVVVKLFGDLADIDHLYLTDRDRMRRKRESPLVMEMIRNAFATRRLLLITPDLTDDLLRSLLSHVIEVQGRFSRLVYVVDSQPSLWGKTFWKESEIHIIETEPEQFLDALWPHINVYQEIEKKYSVPKLRRPLHPFKFLDYFDERDIEIFFGRQKEIEATVTQIQTTRMFVLTGESGTGKTSLLLAGVLPYLQNMGFLTLVVRLVDDPLENVKRRLISLDQMQVLQPAVLLAKENVVGPRTNQRLVDSISTVQEVIKKPLVLVLDQFEEFFIRFPSQSQYQFINELAEVIRCQNVTIHVVVALREDAFVQLHMLRDQIPTIFENTLRLQRLEKLQAEESITKPLEVFGLQFEDDLIQEILRELSQGGDIDPPQLQIVCDKVYQTLLNVKGKLATISLYDSLGRAPQILSRYLEDSLVTLSSEQRTNAREILKKLVTSYQTKSLRSVTELANLTSIDPHIVRETVKYLISLRLVRAVTSKNLIQEDIERYELSHDYLALSVSAWVSENGRLADATKEILGRAWISWNEHKLLLREEELKVVAKQRVNPELILNKREKELIFRSAIKYDNEIGEWFKRLESIDKQGEEFLEVDFVKIIREHLYDRNVRTRISAARWLGEFASKNTRKDLLELSLTDESLDVRMRAATSLLNIDLSSKQDLVESLSISRVRLNAAQILWNKKYQLRLPLSLQVHSGIILVSNRVKVLMRTLVNRFPRYALITSLIIVLAISITILAFLGSRTACERNILLEENIICSYVNPKSTPPIEPLEHIMLTIPEGNFISTLSGTEVSEYLDSYSIDKYEVTNEKYRQCVLAGVCRAPVNSVFDLENYSQHPVTDINLEDAENYCQWINGYLPSELQWEKAARGSDGYEFPWGNDTVQANQANICDAQCTEPLRVEGLNDGYSTTAPVGSFSHGASPFGVEDMVGNVWEWTNESVTRGGSWQNDRRLNKATSRVEIDSNTRNSAVGFRCTLSP